MKKSFTLLLGALLLSLCLTGCEAFSNLTGILTFRAMVAASDDHAEKEEIFAYVQENTALLLGCIAAEDYTVLDNDGLIRKISPDDGCIEFYCGGAGFGPSTFYCGFYYSPEDDLTAIWCAPAHTELKAYGDGYQAKYDGDNVYYTEWICDHFYYYEASF